MNSESAFHDHAYKLAMSLLALIENLVRPEERREVFEALYDQCKAALRCYEESADRMQRRVRPSAN